MPTLSNHWFVSCSQTTEYTRIGIHSNTNNRLALKISPQTTLTQARFLAVQWCARTVLNQRLSSVPSIIFIDEAFMKFELSRICFKSKISCECLDLLRTLSNNSITNFVSTKALCLPGTNTAIKLATREDLPSLIGPEPHTPLNIGIITRQLRLWLVDEYFESWELANRYNGSYSKKLVGSHRRDPENSAL